MNIEDRRRMVTAARVGRLATVTANGRPHVVPCCFVLATVGVGERVEDVLYSAVDAKPKSTLDLKRLDNVRASPAASLVIDHYDDDWTALWWVRLDGSATVLDPGPETDRALELLADKYEQYRTTAPPGAVLRIAVTGWADWTADSGTAPDGRS
jgi:PPOX class probable F420-dependent enzyme